MGVAKCFIVGMIVIIIIVIEVSKQLSKKVPGQVYYQYHNILRIITTSLNIYRFGSIQIIVISLLKDRQKTGTERFTKLRGWLTGCELNRHSSLFLLYFYLATTININSNLKRLHVIICKLLFIAFLFLDHLII